MKYLPYEIMGNLHLPLYALPTHEKILNTPTDVALQK